MRADQAGDGAGLVEDVERPPDQEDEYDDLHDPVAQEAVDEAQHDARHQHGLQNDEWLDAARAGRQQLVVAASQDAEAVRDDVAAGLVGLIAVS